MLNLLPKGVQIFKTFLVGDFFHLPPVSTTPVGFKERIRDKSIGGAADTAGRCKGSSIEGRGGAGMEFTVRLQSSTLHLKGTF
jgi:hypothetical protein